MSRWAPRDGVVSAHHWLGREPLYLHSVGSNSQPEVVRAVSPQGSCALYPRVTVPLATQPHSPWLRLSSWATVRETEEKREGQGLPLALKSNYWGQERGVFGALSKLKANFFIVHSTEYNAAWQDAHGPAQGEVLQTNRQVKAFLHCRLSTLWRRSKSKQTHTNMKPSRGCVSPMGMQRWRLHPTSRDSTGQVVSAGRGSSGYAGYFHSW